MSNHAALTGLDLHQPWHYVQESDPGAIGAGLTWFKKSTKVLSYRNDANDGWISILASSNENALPTGTTWTEFLAAYASTDPGDTIVLPDSIDQEENFYLDKGIRIRGGSPTSRLYLPEKVTSPTAQIWTGYQTDITAVTVLDSFILEHAPGIEGEGFGDNAIRFFSGSYNIYVNNVTFRNITSVCSGIYSQGWAETNPLWQTVQNIFVTNCTGDEWYESFFDLHEMSFSVKNVYIIGNTGTTTAANPNGFVSRPYGVYCSAEEDAVGGFVENFHVANNRLICAMGSNANTVGIRFKRTESPLVRYHRCYVTNNYIENWAQPFGTANINNSYGSDFVGDAFIYVYGNTFYGGGNPMINLTPYGDPPSTTTVYFGDNDIYKSSSAVGINNDPFAPATVVLDPPNRITDF